MPFLFGGFWTEAISAQNRMKTKFYVQAEAEGCMYNDPTQHGKWGRKNENIFSDYAANMLSVAMHG